MKRGMGSTRRVGAIPPMFGDPRALCRDHDGDLFYPERYDSPEGDAARAICGGCVLKPTCLGWALVNERHGIWASLSPSERAAIGGVHDNHTRVAA